MNVEKVINELAQKYTGKKIVKNKEENPTEIICEIDPAANHPERGVAIAVIDRSEPHYHRKAIETYKVTKGELNVVINNQAHKLKEGEKLIIKPGDIHYAIGNETWVEVYSEPGWTPEDHILAGMTSAFIIHGSNGSKDSHWYPWLKEELERKGLQVFLPQFPIGENQTLQNWLDALKPMKDNLKDSILIGHSLGVPFILNVLNQWDVKAKAAFLVAGFSGHLEAEREPNLDDFAERDFNWKKIKENCNHFYVIHSDNDPYIPLERAEEVAKNLGVKVNLVKGGEHFQDKSGFKTFPQLLEKIEEVL